MDGHPVYQGYYGRKSYKVVSLSFLSVTTAGQIAAQERARIEAERRATIPGYGRTSADIQLAKSIQGGAISREEAIQKVGSLRVQQALGEVAPGSVVNAQREAARMGAARAQQDIQKGQPPKPQDLKALRSLQSGPPERQLGKELRANAPAQKVGSPTFALAQQQPAPSQPGFKPTSESARVFQDLFTSKSNLKPQSLLQLYREEKPKGLNTPKTVIKQNEQPNNLTRNTLGTSLKVLSNIPTKKLVEIGESLKPFSSEVFGFAKGAKNFALAVPKGLSNIGGLIYDPTTSQFKAPRGSETLEVLKKPETQAALIAGVLVLPEVIIPAASPYILSGIGGVFEYQAAKEFIKRPSGETLAGVVVTGAGFLPSVAKAGRRVAFRGIGEFVPAEQVFAPEVLSGKSSFPLAKSPELAVKEFELTRTKQGIPVVHTTEGGFGGSLNEKGNVAITPGPAGKRLLEDPGLYVTPFGKGSPYFTKLPEPKSLPVPTLIEKVPSPEIVFTRIAEIKRQPESVLRIPGFEKTSEFLQTQAGSKTAFITKRSEESFNPALGKPTERFLLQKGVSAKAAGIASKGTRELEAVLPVGSELKELRQGNFLQRLTGINKFTEFRGEVVKIREFELLGEEGGKPKQFKNKPTNLAEFERLSSSSERTLRDLSNRELPILRTKPIIRREPSNRNASRLEVSNREVSRPVVRVSEPLRLPSQRSLEPRRISVPQREPSRPSSSERPIRLSDTFRDVFRQGPLRELSTQREGPVRRIQKKDTYRIKLPKIKEFTFDFEERKPLTSKYSASLVAISRGIKRKAPLYGKLSGLEVRPVVSTKGKVTDLAEALRSRTAKQFSKTGGDFKIRF